MTTTPTTVTSTDAPSPGVAAGLASTAAPLAGKVAVVTGGSRGIGAATVRRLAADGAAVVFSYLSSTAVADALVAEVAEAGGRAVAVQADAADLAATTAVVERAVAEFGGLDIVVANAAVFEVGPLPEITMATFDKAVGVNVRSTFALIQAAARHLRRNGRVIITGSINADQALVPGTTVNATTKAAVAGMARGLALDLADRAITVNVVQPGPIDTELNPASGPFGPVLTPLTALQRYGRADEVASMIGYLASPAAGYVTGASLNVDGGLAI